VLSSGVGSEGHGISRQGASNTDIDNVIVNEASVQYSGYARATGLAGTSMDADLGGVDNRARNRSQT